MGGGQQWLAQSHSSWNALCRFASMTEQPQHWPHVQQSHNHTVQFSGGVDNKDACGVRSLTMYCWFKIFELQLELATCLHPGWQWGTVDCSVKGQACPCRRGRSARLWLRNGILPYVVDDMILCYRFKNQRLLLGLFNCAGGSVWSLR